MLTGLLHLLPPEEAHQLTLTLLQTPFVPRYKWDGDLSINLFDRKLRNPVGLSGGADKMGAALRGWARLGFGLVEAGTVTLNPRAGNPKPRIWRFPPQSALVNWMGLPNAGIETFAANLKTFQNAPERQELCLGASIASPDGIDEEFTKLAAACAPLVDYITLNASCPNTEEAKSENAPHKVAARQIKAVKKGSSNRPVLVKLAPSLDKAGLKLMAEEALAAGAQGFVATNTLPFALKKLSANLGINWPTHDGKPVGGFSGPQLLDIACFMVRELRVLAGRDAPIIGVGGVQSGADAWRLLDAGANAIQLYTGLTYKGPALLRDIMQALQTRKPSRAKAA